MFFFPSGVSVERHVSHGLGSSGGRVKQSTCGTLEEVPVPRKMNSIGAEVKISMLVDDVVNSVCKRIYAFRLCTTLNLE